MEISRARAWLVAVAGTLAMSVSYIDRQILAALGKSVREALTIDHTQFGWLAAAFSIAYLVAAPIAGVVVDRVGARVALVVAMLVWSCVSAAHAFVGTFAMLFALRIALGTAEAPSFPAAAQAIRRVLPPRDRSAGFGLLFTGSSIGAMIAAPLAVWVKASHGWRAAFLVGSAVGLAWLPLWLLATNQDRVRARLAEPDVETSFAKQERSRAKNEHASRWVLLRDPVVHRAVVLVLMTAPSIMFVLIWFPQFLERAFLVPENNVGRYAWMPPLFFDAGAVLFGVLASRREKNEKYATKKAISSHADLVVVAAVLATMLVLVPYSPSPWTSVALASASLAGGGALFARLTADMLARVDPSHVSTAGGLTAAAQSLAYVVANPLVGRSVDRTRSFTAAVVTLGCLVIPGALAWVVWPIQKTISSE